MINQKPHYGFAHVGGRLTLDFKTTFTAWISKLAGATGAEVVIFVADKDWLKTRQQEKGFHAMIAPLVVKTGWKIEALKQYLLGEIFGWADLTDGIRVLVEPSTAALSKRQYSELIEHTLEIAATEFDTWLEAPSEWTARKEKARKQAERAAKQAA